MSVYHALAITAFGGPRNLTQVQRSIPALKAGELLVKVSYAGVNPIDCKTRQGLGWAAEQNRDNLPWVPGYDMAGVVVRSDDLAIPVGSKVAGMVGFPSRGGCYAEYLIAHADELVILPPGLDLAQAAALSLAGLTAWQGLFEHGALQKGERVAISAAAGGVGHLAVQLAKARGAQVVAMVSPENYAFVRSLGADEVINYHDSDMLIGIERCDLLLDLAGGESGVDLLPLVKPGGRVVSVPTLTREHVCNSAIARGLKATGMLVKPNHGELTQLFAYLDNGTIKVEIAQIFLLCDGVKAHQLSELGHVRGKLLLSMP